MLPQKENKFTEICTLTFNNFYCSNSIYVCNDFEDIQKVRPWLSFGYCGRTFQSGKEKN